MSKGMSVFSCKLEGREEDEPALVDLLKDRAAKKVAKKDCVRRELNPGPSLGKRRS